MGVGEGRSDGRDARAHRSAGGGQVALLRSEPARRWPGSLPVELTSFIGRERDIAAIHQALASARLLTLVGAGGCGKSRLALRVAAAARERFEGGAWWIDLGELSDREQVEAAIAGALRVRPLPGQTGLDAAVSRIAASAALLVLDNCEHLPAASAAVIERLLRGCPNVSVIATSRAPLHVVGETRMRVAPLSLPSGLAREPATALEQSDAVRLFCARARDAEADFALDRDNVAAVKTICRTVDGLALAIELAAARVRMMSVHEIADALPDCLGLLTGGPRGAPDRQQTLRRSVEWSYALLGDEERLLLRRLAVFDGGWTHELAREVASGPDVARETVLDLMSGLIDQSLVVIEERGRTTRMRLLASVRAFALEQLALAGEEPELRSRHCAAMRAFAEAAAPQLTSSDQRRWLARMDAEHINLTQALEHAVATDAAGALRIAVAMTFHYRRTSRFAAAERAFGAALAAGEHEPGRGEALVSRAYLAAHAGRWTQAIDDARAAARLATACGDRSTEARALGVIGFVQQFSDPSTARELLVHARALSRACGDPWCEAFAAQNLAWAHHVQDRVEDAVRIADDALPSIEREDLAEFRARHHLLMALAAFARADWSSFEQLCAGGLDLARAIDEPLLDGSFEIFLGWSEVLRGRITAAIARAPRARERALRAGAGMILPGIEYLLAWADVAEGRTGPALERLAAIIATEIDRGPYLARALVLQAEVRRTAGDRDGALGALRRARALAAHLGAAWLMADVHLVDARIALDADDWAAAGGSVHEALELVDEHRLIAMTPCALDALAAVAAGLRRDADAARLLGAAAGSRRRHGLALLLDADRGVAVRRRLAERMGDEQLAAGLRAGESLATAEAVAWARRGRGRRRRPAAGWASLTPTEREIVGHVCAGCTNPQIAERMFISRGTVKTHLSHVYAKLGVGGRSALAAVAARHDRPGAS